VALVKNSVGGFIHFLDMMMAPDDGAGGGAYKELKTSHPYKELKTRHPIHPSHFVLVFVALMIIINENNH
jgi:hypothetical protein